jgi:CubicO group peptidase (beta-lactamase class C family)
MLFAIRENLEQRNEFREDGWMAKRMMRLIAVCLCLIACTRAILAADPVSGWAGLPASHNFSPITAKIQGWLDKGYYPGASLIVYQDNHLVYLRYFGDFKPDTVIYIASAGKWLAAATIAAVVDEGKLSWDDPVSRWIPQMKGTMGTATLRQLLSHTSGYQTYQPAGCHPDDYQTLKEAVDHIIPLEPEAPPGTRFHYGGLALQVAGRMAELATGKDWETLFQEKIAGPCRMQATHFTPVDPGVGHNPMLGGGARSTLHDYANFLAMINAGGEFNGRRVLSAKSIREMQADQVRGAKVQAGNELVEKMRGTTYNGIYGLGEWREQLDAKGNAVLISSPSWAGAYPWIDKTHRVYGFFLAHVDTAKTGPANFNAFFESPVLPILVRQAVDESPNGKK